jgi:uncharacterized phage protein (TIGR01671 family)
MREIKFRAYVKEEEKVLPVYSLDFSWLESHPVSVAGCGDLDCGICIDHYEKEKVELMQYTGLKDKNGKEIYEGDVVELIMPDTPFVIQGNGYSDVDIEKGFVTVGVVRFLYSCWFIDQGDGKGCPLDFDEKQQIEVKGNEFENPELLEAAE